jgi:hypothetical protein
MDGDIALVEAANSPSNDTHHLSVGGRADLGGGTAPLISPSRQAAAWPLSTASSPHASTAAK